MKIYKVKVNGKVYEVEIESVTESAGSIQAPVQAAPQQAAPAAQPAQASGVEQAVVAPMAGTILDVKVSVGQAVEVGQVVAILEAMKLENEIVSTAAGVVKQVAVNKGQSVNNQEVIIIVG